MTEQYTRSRYTITQNILEKHNWHSTTGLACLIIMFTRLPIPSKIPYSQQLFVTLSHDVVNAFSVCSFKCKLDTVNLDLYTRY